MSFPIMPGAEPMSVAGGSHGVLVLHGFTGNPQSMRPIADALSGAGFTVEMPLLTGHGTDVSEMMATRFADWAGVAEDAYADLASRCDAVAIAALSMGGTLACHLASTRPEIAGLVLVNPLIAPGADSFLDLLRGGLEAGTDMIPGVGSDIAVEGVVESAYPGTPVAPLLSLFEAVAELAPRLSAITCPIRLYSSRQDHVVPSESGDVLCESVSGPVERIWLERSFHVATLDYDREVIANGTLEFAGTVLGGPGTDRG